MDSLKAEPSERDFLFLRFQHVCCYSDACLCCKVSLMWVKHSDIDGVLANNTKQQF